ncbi:ciliary microtubule inner protein 2C isoform X1 [Tamandua tetradactyla]|uniref:ciliary microtubule inner protein 2C isoform X1 n=1 Tax=Tamandua tetradactyla TaxID=48850 RepID=UPI0040542193
MSRAGLLRKGQFPWDASFPPLSGPTRQLRKGRQLHPGTAAAGEAQARGSGQGFSLVTERKTLAISTNTGQRSILWKGYVKVGLGTILGYQGHVPSAAFSFGSTYGSTTLKYFQDRRHTTMEKSHTPYSKGGHFPTLFSPDPNLVLSNQSNTWDRWLRAPSYTRFNLDSDRAAALARFYQASSDSKEQVAPFKSVPREPEDLPDIPIRQEGCPARAAAERLLLRVQSLKPAADS